MPTGQILIAAGIGLFVVWVAYRMFRRPADEGRPVQLSVPGGAPSALPPSVVRGNWLVGVGGDIEGKTFHVGARTVTVGRGVSNYVQTTDPDASRVHCRLTPIPTGLRVNDLDSRNGTLVNGVQTTEALLKNGDELQIGQARFQFNATGSYRFDHALGGKVASPVASSKTIMDGNLNVHKLAKQALDEADGDVQLAAQKMGITPEVLLRLLE